MKYRQLNEKLVVTSIVPSCWNSSKLQII